MGPVDSPRLEEADKLLCDGPISNNECKHALENMKNNKAASVSGFSKEFFLFFWSELGDLVVDYINQAKQQGQFFVTQRRGVITLIPKKGDQKMLANKPAICLLDIIYKIVAKALSVRLMAVIHKIVANDQTGSIKGRYIGTNLRTIADVIYYCDADQLNGILMALDFKNAFNSVELSFVYKVLRHFNFGESFISWVQLLHSRPELAIINNGYTSQWFQPTRGLQQGCPASALLFALVVEILAIKLRKTLEVKGIEVSGRNFKISQYCDDMTLFVADAQSADKALQIVREFGVFSGLELNIDKCSFMWLGKAKWDQNTICGRAPTSVIKILGVKYSATRDCRQANLDAVKIRIKRTLDQWSERSLTLKGKITVAKSFIVSQLAYLMAATSIEKGELAVIQSHIMKFIWRGRPPKVAKCTLGMKIQHGGLNVPDLASMNVANRIVWIGRMLRLQEVTFVQVLQERIRSDLRDIVQVKYDIRRIRSRPVPEYYKEMLTCFFLIGPDTRAKNWERYTSATFLA